MGEPTLNAGSILTVIGIVSAIFHMGMYIGWISNKLARHEDQIAVVDGRLNDHDDELKFLKGLR